MSWNELKEKLEENKEKSSDLPPFFDPEEESKLMGKVVEKRPSNFDNDNFLYHIQNPETSEVRTTPEHAALMSGLKQKEVDVGDYVLIEYQGQERSKSSGRMVFTYEIGVIKKEDAGDIEPTDTPDDSSSGDEDMQKIKEIIDFFEGEVEEEEFLDLCETKGIEDPLEKYYLESKDGKVVFVEE